MFHDSLRKYLVLTVAAVLSLIQPHLASAAENGALRIGNTDVVDNINPLTAFGNWNQEIIRNVYEGLVTYTASGELIPGYAESWTVSSDGLTYDFHLRKNARWSDGEPLTSQDFLRSWQLSMTEITDGPAANHLLLVKNAQAIIDGKLGIEALGITAPDPHLLRIKLETPASYFLALLTHTSMAPTPSHLKQRLDLAGNWTGMEDLVYNGAYVVKEITEDDSLILIANPFYYERSSIKMDTIKVIPYDRTSGSDGQIRDFTVEKLDIARVAPSSQASFDTEKFNASLFREGYSIVQYYTLNQNIEPFDKPEIRRAISMAIDRDKLVGQIAADSGTPAYLFMSPLTAKYPNNLAPAWMNIPMDERILQARKLVESHGYSAQNPIRSEISFNNVNIHERAANAIRSMLSQIHIEVTLVSKPVRDHYAALRRHDFGIGRGGWSAEFNDAYNFISLFTSKSPRNYGDWNNPEYDGLIKKYLATTNQEESNQLLVQALEMIIDHTPVIPLYYSSQLSLVSPKIQGYEQNLLRTHLYRWMSWK